MRKINFIIQIPRMFAPKNTKGIKYALSATKPAENTLSRRCEMRYHVEDSNVMTFGSLPQNYINTSKFWVEAEPAREIKFGSKIRFKPATEAHWEEYNTLKAAYHLDHLFSHGKGQGQNAVKELVRTSLKDPKTQGRVTIDADIIDGKTSPAGFYYKMGFRASNEYNNEQLAKWLTEGGKRENAPMLTGMMYLPRENILRCLYY